MAHLNSTTSQAFYCAWCGSDVVLTVQPGGDLTYQCVNERCCKAVSVDTPEALGVRAHLLAELAPEPTPPAAPAAQRAADKAAYHLALGVRIARARGAVLVPSATTANVVYRVENGRCNCEAGQRGRPCWHTAAARMAA